MEQCDTKNIAKNEDRFAGTGQGMLMKTRCYNMNESNIECSSYFRLSYARFDTFYGLGNLCEISKIKLNLPQTKLGNFSLTC